ncbi:MAG: LapA family protein [Halanaerobacter sp.]
MRLNFIVALILSIIVASFAIVNSKIITINLLFTTVSVSQALVIFISVSIGAIIALLFGLVKEIKLKKQLKEKRKEVKDLIKDKENLKGDLTALKKGREEDSKPKQQSTEENNNEV